MERNSVFWKIYLILIIATIIPAFISNALVIFSYQNIINKHLADMESGGSLADFMEQSVSLQDQQRSILIQGLLIILFSTVIAASLIAIYMTRSLMRPLRDLDDKKKAVARGSFDVVFNQKRNDEIGELGRGFNKMVQDLKESFERQKLVSQMKSEFISLAAHQLRTPLSAVKWTIRMLLDGDMGALETKQKEFLEKGYATNEKMIRLINDLLDVARIEEGRFGYSFDLADISELIEKTIEEQSLVAQKRNIRVVFRKPVKPFPKIKIDASKVMLAIENLLENSINYTFPGGLIEVGFGPGKDNFIEVVIKDTGVGIPKEQFPRLFGKFFRGENVMRMQTEGSGLGLFIVKNIVKRHGGEIWIESEEGIGTTVHFTLPLEEKLIPEKEEAFEEFIAGF